MKNNQVSGWRKAGIGLVTGLATLVTSASLGGCEEKPTPAQNQVQVQKVEEKVAEKQYAIGDLVDTIEVQINYGKIFDLKHQGAGVYRGRDNKLIGSEIIEISYNFNYKKTYVSVEIEGSLFTPKKSYSAIVDGHPQNGGYAVGYVVKSKDGEELDLIVQDPFHNNKRKNKTLYETMGGLGFDTMLPGNLLGDAFKDKNSQK